MTPADKPKFLEALVALGELLKGDFTRATLELYWTALVDLDGADVGRAMDEAARRCTFMPRPAELRALVLGTPEERALEAWARVHAAARAMHGYTSRVTFGDAAIHATIEAMGGWGVFHTLGFAAPTDVEVATARKTFTAHYQAFEARGAPAGTPSHVGPAVLFLREKPEDRPLLELGPTGHPALAAPPLKALPEPEPPVEDAAAKLRELTEAMRSKMTLPPSKTAASESPMVEDPLAHLPIEERLRVLRQAARDPLHEAKKQEALRKFRA